MKLAKATAVLVAVCLLLATACGDDSDDSSGSASGSASGSGTASEADSGTASDLCPTLEALDPTVATLTGTGDDSGDTTVADAKEAVSEFEQDLQDAQDDDNAELPSGVESALDSAAAGLQDALDDLADSEALEDAGDAVASAQTAIASAWTSLLEALNCSPS
jgi:hypothetical protein